MYIQSKDIREITRTVKNVVKNHTALLFVGEHSDIDIAMLISSLKENNISFIGGVFPKVIHQNTTYEKGLVVSVLKNVFEISTILDISTKKYDIPPVSFSNHKKYSLITFVDGLTSNISAFLGKLYEKYGMKTNYFGGGAGSLSLKQAPCVFSKEGIFQDAAVFVIMEMESSIGVKHGWKKLEGPYIVTKADKNTVEEINWKNPFKTYQLIVEEDAKKKFTATNFFEIAKGYPLGIIKQGFDHIIRDPLSINEKKELVCVGEVEENTLINIMQGDASSLIKASLEAAKESISKAKTPSTAIVIDCISRILYLEEDFKHELNNVSQAIVKKYPEIPVNGALTLGEISSYGNGYIEFYNKTIVVGLFE
ncbi:FIST signal transduction protein [Tenacibaculum sp. SG-28]|uniref:FIST signal transduction protein n=1 Tax=Tenacibaculum sp. SG-28 TaxID=754426 RepID=UPI001304B358|nr:FIST N-terminal domain-containing protein [Tenacibaculum sp. SG-28]